MVPLRYRTQTKFVVLPPARFRRLGGQSFYCTWAQLVLFGGGIVTNMDAPSLGQTVVDAGAQLDFRLVLFSALESTLSAGWAAAAVKDARFKREFMVSLKILR